MKKGIIIIITALNILGEQNVNDLAKLGITAVNVTAENTSDKLFKVSNHAHRPIAYIQQLEMQDIAQGTHRVIVVSPEKILSDSRFQKLWANKQFMNLLFAISIDEAHCITE